MIFNTHTHVFNAYNSKELIEEAIKNNVTAFLFVGYDVKTSMRAVKMAHQYQAGYAAVGIHPSEVGSITQEDYDQITALLKDPKVVALGEIGLDYHYEDNPSPVVQKEHFERFIRLANEFRKPIIVHMRDADQDTLDVLKKNKELLHNGIMHCYSGSYELANEFIKLGLCISFAGPLTFHNANKLKDVATRLPLDKILIETDDPYLAPMPFRGQKNRPALITYVAKELARLRNISYEECCKATYENASKLFKL